MTATLMLTRGEVASLLTQDECIVAVEQAFRQYGEGKVAPPGIIGVHVEGGGFHIKAACLDTPRKYFAAKLNGNFCHNHARFGLPAIQGIVVLCDATNGLPLALMDSIEITIQRTGAATAVAARHLARRDSQVATVCGCGNQGRVQFSAITRVAPIRQLFAFDQDTTQAQRFAEEITAGRNIAAQAVADLAVAVEQSDIVITCTPSQHFFLCRDHVRPGTFIAAVGADSPQKQELEPALMRGSKVVVDLLEQCASIGDLHHALEAGAMSRACVHAELGELAAGHKAGRTSEDEITIFDSTGTALQDVAAAVLVYEKALQSGVGTPFRFAAAELATAS
jgi:alanine dehydrogenase